MYKYPGPWYGSTTNQTTKDETVATDILDQLAKILNQAMNTDNEHEKDLFFKQAQKLSTKHGIELAQARSHIAKLEKREQPVVMNVDLSSRGTQNRHVWCSLFMSIGKANDLVFDIAHDSTYVIAFGMPSDIEVTKALYANLSVQMIEMCEAYLKLGEWRSETCWDPKQYRHKPIHSRVAKRQFFESFSSRIGNRLREARREAITEVVAEERETLTEVDLTEAADAGRMETSTELVVLAKTVEVSDFHKQNSRASGTWKGGRGNTYRSNSGSNAGRSAANNARIGGEKALAGGRRAIG